MRIILEMANNHQGSLDRGKQIIDDFAFVLRTYPAFDFTFKFQYRTLEDIIHPDFQLGSPEYPYLERFSKTYLYNDELRDLKEYAESLGFSTLCTPFDEAAVDTVVELGFKEIKIGSCSAADWSLLNKVAEAKLPVILSVGGLDDITIDAVVQFFQHRDIPLTLMHCKGIYPTDEDCLGLYRIDELVQYGLPVGLSSHGHPENTAEVYIAIAKGCDILEKHVDLDDDKINKYSMTPKQFDLYLQTVRHALNICMPNTTTNAGKIEQVNLAQFKRGAYLKREKVFGEYITRNDVFFAMPAQPGQLCAEDFGKYDNYTVEAIEGFATNAAVMAFDVRRKNIQEQYQTIVDRVNDTLCKHNIVIPQSQQIEISHHYGMDIFNEFGMCILPLINEEYCKKILVLQPGQTNPTHYHKVKTETFFILAGKASIMVDDIEHILSKGQFIKVCPGEKHRIQAWSEGVIIEELSTHHVPDDSFYEDEEIQNATNRKTIVYA
jgi:sialic acid synthase SpsE/quercetin dioxygenase-like cupin family protein